MDPLRVCGRPWNSESLRGMANRKGDRRRNLRKYPRSHWLRFAVIVTILCAIALFSFAFSPLENAISSVDSRDLESDLECGVIFPTFCDVNTSCTLLANAFGVCCDTDDYCVTSLDQQCSKDQICTAALIPGLHQPSSCLLSWELRFGAFVYAAVMIYIFVGLAIVCDDYFVISLEKISVALDLSDDVAGATFMAAGSSAPELFVSLADNVISSPPKELGIGTIIGSAVFNILVIIGLCALLSKSVLPLNWRPFARDSFFYIFSVAAMVLVVMDSYVTWWESLILLGIYVGYIVFMKFSAQFFELMDRKLGIDKSEQDTDNPAENSPNQDAENGFNPAVTNSTEAQTFMRTRGMPKQSNSTISISVTPVARHTVETSRPVAVIERAAESGLGRRLFRHGSESNLINQPRQLQSRRHIFEASRATFNEKFPLLSSRFRIHRYRSLKNPHEADTFESAMLRAKETFGNPEKLEAAQRLSVVKESEFEESLKDDSSVAESVSTVDANEEVHDEENYWEPLVWPMCNIEERTGNERSALFVMFCRGWKQNWLRRLWYIIGFPFNLLFRLTIPDASFDVFREDKAGKPENRVFAYSLGFIMSIIWIAVLSHLLVFSATNFGCMVQAPPILIGLTLVAAGTSVPDAMSSIIVARKGFGNMAVANALGSNIFDILVGMGFPLFLSTAIVYRKSTYVDVGNLLGSFGVLAGVLFGVVILFCVFRWKLRKPMGVILLLLYVGYVLYEIFV